MIRRVLLLLALAAPLRAQAPSVSCAVVLDSLRHRIETNYAGYALEVTGARRDAYARFADSLRAASVNTTAERCFPRLRRFAEWFEDPHLFIYQSARVDTAVARERRAEQRIVATSEPAVRAYLDRRGRALDPIEGIWSSGRLRVAILADSAQGALVPNRFVAVVLTPDTATWLPGAVRGEMLRHADGTYETAMLEASYALRHLRPRVHRRTLLRFSPGIWGREYPVADADRGLVDPIDPHRAVVQVRGRTVVVAIPSHDPTYRGALDSALARHRTALESAELLIVDLRGNEGGSSWLTNGLRPYIDSERKRGTPFDTGRAVMRSSPDQIAYARRAFGPDTSLFVRGLLARMAAAPGGLVPLEDPDAPPRPARPDSIVRGPRAVGVLVDGGTVSAAEVLVLDALRSERARVFGEPTAGALDYQSVNVVPILDGERRFFLGYPTITARASLPGGGMRGRGIAPDVRVRWDEVADPIGHVERALREWLRTGQPPG